MNCCGTWGVFGICLSAKDEADYFFDSPREKIKRLGEKYDLIMYESHLR